MHSVHRRFSPPATREYCPPRIGAPNLTITFRVHVLHNARVCPRECAPLPSPVKLTPSRLFISDALRQRMVRHGDNPKRTGNSCRRLSDLRGANREVDSNIDYLRETCAGGHRSTVQEKTRARGKAGGWKDKQIEVH